MLLLHEVHTVAGRHEDEFEAAFRDRLDARRSPTDDDARLLYYLKLAHGTGRAYQVVTITALRDGTAYERLATPRAARRPARVGGRRRPAAARGRGQAAAPGRLVTDAATSTSRRCPTDGREHEPALYMEDSAWPYEAKLDTYLETARTHYAPSLEQQTARSLLTLLGVFQAALGAARRREVVLWQRVDFPERLPGLFTHGAARAREGTGHVDARRARSARRLGEPAAAQRELVPAGLSAPRRARPARQSQAVPPVLPPSSGHSPANTPQLHSKPGTTHACAIQMSVSSRFCAAARRALLARLLLATDHRAALVEAEAAVRVVLVPVVVGAGETVGRATRVEHEVAEADDLGVGVGAVVEQLGRRRGIELRDEREFV